VLAVAGDAEGTVTLGRLLAKRACSAIVETLAPFTPGGTARFDEEWNPRAFGDNITAWGTPVVLIESGGLPPGHSLEDLTRLNFVALVTVLRGLARNDLQDHDPRIYDDLPRNRRNAWADYIVRGGFIRQPGLDQPYRADLAFNVEIDDRDAAGCGTGIPRRSYIVEVGDARVLAAGRVVDAAQSLVVAPFVAGVDGWSARKWLRAEVLSDLARLGVGTVVWKVSPRKAQRANTMVRELRGEGLARLEVVSSSAKLPSLIVTRPPRTPDSDALYDVLRALAGDAEGAGSMKPVPLEKLAGMPGSQETRPTLRRGRPASFLLLTPAAGGTIDLENVRLSSVFIDGVEVRGGSR
jgi:hypothetical protein